MQQTSIMRARLLTPLLLALAVARPIDSLATSVTAPIRQNDGARTVARYEAPSSYGLPVQSGKNQFELTNHSIEPLPALDLKRSFYPSTAEASGLKTRRRSDSANATGGSGLCQKGAKLEGQWGITWYAVTVLDGPNDQGQCRISFDGYGSVWDSWLNMDLLRPKGSGTTQPVPGADAEPAVANTEVPDGSYRCHKISGNQLIDIGAMEVDDGEANLPGLPEGWVITNLSVRGTNSRGELVVALDYRSASGNSDRMDCIPD